ncbi:hypothetical protein NWF32_18000 [Pseudomonas qingdaonensis]|nr:hypothetical protein [Pseudomonas qingdaonensis]
MFSQLHGELYDADYWKGLQAAIREEGDRCVPVPAQVPGELSSFAGLAGAKGSASRL